jgi:hypothetical protein
MNDIITIGCLGLILHKKDTVTNLPWRRSFGRYLTIISVCLKRIVARIGASIRCTDENYILSSASFQRPWFLYVDARFAMIMRVSVDPRNELPSHNLAIACPVFAILDGTPRKTQISKSFILEGVQDNTARHAPLEITGRTMNEHCDEEYAVEVWDGRCCADDQAPGEAHGPVCHIVLYLFRGQFI